MRARSAVLIALSLLVAASPARAQEESAAARQVFEAEAAFAAALAARDFDAFAAHVADDAVFFSTTDVQRGKAAVLDRWRQFFAGPDAPFSWAPERVEVLSSGTLALSSGPVRDPSGRQIGTFNSIWRLEPDGRWRVVFDKGCGS